MALQTLPNESSTDAILAALDRDGAAIIGDAMTDELREQIVGEISPYIDRTPFGTDDFTGRNTQRTGALIARSPGTRETVLHPAILDSATQFLAPYTDRVILHLTQSIYIHPQQGEQILHRDRLAWGAHIPLSIEPQFNTMWALTEFTARNGATRIVPGSHRWDWDRQAKEDEIVPAVMSPGSVLLYTGSVLHSGGRNDSDAPRLGLNLTYCLGWLRQEENQYLSCPPAIARNLDPELQELLGYTQGNYALGYYSDPNSSVDGRDLLPPEMALGRMPRDTRRFSASEVTDHGPDTEFLERATGQNL